VVRRYINDSKAVVVLINVPKRDDDQEDGQVQFTQGVIWELYNNIEHRDKFIYCIDKISSHTSSGYLDLLDEDKKEHSLTKCIVSLLDQAESTTFPEDRCVFTYDGENCVLFNELKEAVKHVIGERSPK
jgi:choline kinase